jgi:predicted Zn-dependent protease
MKTLLLATLALGFVPAASAQFNFGKLSQGLDTLKDVGKVAKGAAKIGPEEEKVIGDSVALEIISRNGGLVHDEEITRRVNLVGRAVARYSARPDAAWRFGVLDSPAINAFSAPDGYVLLTRGLYDLADSDDALAAVLGHEIAHITKRHALSIVERGEFLSGVTNIASKQSGNVQQVQAQLKQFDLGIEKIISTLFEKGFDPQTEYEADREGRSLATTTGYAPDGLKNVLTALEKKGAGPQPIFSTHPPLKERIKRL